MEEEGSFVTTHNLVSRSSARVLRLQQGMLGMAPQRPLVRESEALLQVHINLYIFQTSVVFAFAFVFVCAMHCHIKYVIY